jgi:uncharacterized protein
MQTNATLLSSDYLDFLRKFFPRLQLGISWDGKGELSQHRVTVGQKQSVEETMRALALCSKEDMPVGVICVVTRTSLGRGAEILRDMSEFSAVRAVKFVPCFDVGVEQGEGPTRRSGVEKHIREKGGKALDWSISPKEYSEFLEEVWEYWVKSLPTPQFTVEPHLSIIKKLKGIPTSNCHFGSQKCGHVYTIYPDGSIGSCDELPKEEASYSAISSLNLRSIVQDRWSKALNDQGKIRDLILKCEKCPVRSTCGGGCIAIRQRMTEDENLAYCEHRKRIISFVEGYL